MANPSSYLLRTEEYLRLTQNQAYIRDSMDRDFMDRAMDKLYEEKLVDFNTHQDFSEISLTSSRAEKVLDLLIRGTSYRYDVFCDFCKEEHPEMYERLFIADYNAALQVDSACDDEVQRGDALTDWSGKTSPPGVLQNMDEQPAIIPVKVIPVVSARVKAKWSQRKTVYASSHPVRGLALLFFNIHFTDRNFPTRSGAQHDLTNLSRLFHDLSYNVKVFCNLTRSETLCELEEQRCNGDNRCYGSFVLGFSTHGANESKAIACSDGKSLYLHEIYRYFDSSHCPYLAGKPKFLFFDTSFGCARDHAVPVNVALNPPKTFEPVKKQLVDISFSLGNIQMDTLKHLPVPTHHLVPLEITHASVPAPKANYRLADKSDFIIAMATVDGYVSWRRNSHGCWFSRVMVEVFANHACDKPLIELLKIIRRKLSYVETKTGCKQVNVTIDTSLKDFYFFPGLPA